MATAIPSMDTLVLHIPKCGGMFVHEAISKYFKEACYAEAVGDECPLHGTLANYGEYSKCFCFIRHPKTWVESWWRFHRGDKYGIPWNPCDFPYKIPYAPEMYNAHIRAENSFERFTQLLTYEYSGVVTRVFNKYIGDPKVQVLRYRDLYKGLRRITKLPERAFRKLTPVNISKTYPVEWASKTLGDFLSSESEIISKFYSDL